MPLDGEKKDAGASGDRSSDGLDPSNAPRPPPGAPQEDQPGSARVRQVSVHAELSRRGVRRPGLPAERDAAVVAVHPAARAQGLPDLARPGQLDGDGQVLGGSREGDPGPTTTHGTQVIVEADRGPGKPAALTQWHYFVVMSARTHRVAVDAFLGEVDADVGHYVRRLGAKSFSYTSERVTAKPVRP